MIKGREKRDIQMLTFAIVLVVAGFSWGVLPGLVCTGAAFLAGLVYHRRWRQSAPVSADPPDDLDVLWYDAELALRRLEHWHCDALPDTVIDRLARTGRQAIEAGRSDPFSPRSGEIRHVLGMISDCLGVLSSGSDQGLTDQNQRLEKLFEDATQTLEHLSKRGSGQNKTLTAHIKVLEREIGLLNDKEKA